MHNNERVVARQFMTSQLTTHYVGTQNVPVQIGFRVCIHFMGYGCWPKGLQTEGLL